MTRVNEKIRAPKIRVVYGEGQQLGVMTPREALEKAKRVGLDLVEIAA
ncbi:translation initiation factor IF-3, partial [Akkermansiaceae bacterium]|nr:translation initiation factor IF-3 [Akkermansiaceae bacterium]